jgi:hypothetical protein
LSIEASLAKAKGQVMVVDRLPLDDAFPLYLPPARLRLGVS